MLKNLLLICALVSSLPSLALALSQGEGKITVTSDAAPTTPAPAIPVNPPTPEADEDIPPEVLVPLPVVICPTKFTSIVVMASISMMATCEAGHTVHSYHVALGRGGIDKKMEGDNKTPLGIYKLGVPKHSDRFGTFIPVGYPTKEQKARGYSGAAVGVHGPDKDFETLGAITTMLNWTAGCIAVGFYSEIDEIKVWTNTKHPSFIQILR